MKFLLLNFILTMATIFVPALASSENLISGDSSFEVGWDNYNATAGYGWQGVKVDKLLEGQAEFDTATAVQGRTSLKLTRIKEDKAFYVWLTFGYLPITIGKEYTFSVYARADRPAVSLSVNVSDGSWAGGISKKWPLTTQWKRYSVSGVVTKAKKNMVWINLSCNIGSVWVDAVQFEAGTLTDYRPAKRMAMGITTQAENNLYFAGDEVVAEIKFFNAGAEPVKGRVEYQMADFFKETFTSGEKNINLVPGNNNLFIPLGQAVPGIFKGRFYLQDRSGRELNSKELIFGVIRKREYGTFSDDSFFGTHDYPNRYAALVGSKWLRAFKLVEWKAVEPQPGKFVFPAWTEEYLADAQCYGMRIMGILGPHFERKSYDKNYGRDNYANMPKWAARGELKNITVNRRKVEYMMPDIKAWSNYVYNVVKKYKNDIKYWEVLNEPSLWMSAEDYFKLLKAAYAAAKRADPSAQIVGFSSTSDYGGVPLDFIRQVADLGGLNYADIVSVHFYKNRPPEMFKRVGLDVVFQQLHEIIRSYGVEKPVWHTEKGHSTPSYYSDIIYLPLKKDYHLVKSAEDAARWMVRANVLTMAAGVEKFFWFRRVLTYDVGSRWIARPASFQFIEYNGTPRPLFPAYAAMTEQLEGAKFVEKINLEGANRGYIFETQNGPLAVVWNWRTKSDKSRNGLALSLPANQIRLVNIMGNEVEKRIKEGKIFIPLTMNPLYVLGNKIDREEFIQSFRLQE